MVSMTRNTLRRVVPLVVEFANIAANAHSTAPSHQCASLMDRAVREPLKTIGDATIALRDASDLLHQSIVRALHVTVERANQSKPSRRSLTLANPPSGTTPSNPRCHPSL